MRLLLAAWLWAVLAGTSWAQDLLPVPALTARVIDQTGTLSDAQRAALEAKLAAYEQAAGPQIVVLMVPTTRPEDIAAYAFRVADSWKIGRREVGDGLLLVVAKNDRALRIEVAKTLEGEIGILPRHIPLVAQLVDDAMVRVEREGEDDLRIAVDGGFLSVTEEAVRILVENAQIESEINADEAKQDSESDDERTAAWGRARLRAVGQLD